jgi:PAS domain S-box-containing protein
MMDVMQDLTTIGLINILALNHIDNRGQSLKLHSSQNNKEFELRMVCLSRITDKKIASGRRPSKYGPSTGLTGRTGMMISGLAAVMLITGALLAWWIISDARAQSPANDAGKPRVLFLGNESLPPICFMKDGKPTGVAVDLAEAIAKRMDRPAQIQLMNWTEAQQQVQDEKADALLQINPNPERLKNYDFSDPLLTSEFTIFVSSDRLGISDMEDLRGLRVGVEEKGLPILLIQEDPQIIIKIIPDFVQGFKMLATGSVDAVVADRWVGSYILAENNIRNVKLVEEPIGQSQSAIAVKKGNTNLLSTINTALVDIKRDGTYERIIDSWRANEVVFKTREQVRRQAWLIAVIIAALISALIGVAVLIREMRRRNRAEELLRHSEEQYRALVENSTDLITRFNRGLKMIYANPVVLQRTGKTMDELIGYTAQEYGANSLSTELWEKTAQKVLETGQPQRFENTSVWQGQERSYDLMVIPEYDAVGAVSSLINIARDITERKRMEEALREREKQLSLFIEHAPASLAMFDREMRYVSASRRWLSDYKLGERDLTGISHYEIFPEISKRWREVHIRGLSGEVVRADADPFEHADGTVQWLRWEVRPWHNAVGEVGGIVIFTEDITEGKKQEEELGRLNRTLRALGNTSKATFHADNESNLLDEACRIIVEDCGYPMVWVGFAEEDGNKTVRPVAQAGFEEGYLEKINITWSDTELGCGPTGTAIRKGTPDVCKNILTDPRMKPWREQAVKRGYASSIGLPLLAGGQTLGALTIYSREPESFSDEEIKLLSELTEELAYGVNVLRLRQAHQQSENELQESKVRLDLALRSSNMGTWHWDIIENKRYFDNQACRLLGINPAIFSGNEDEFFRVVHPDDRESIKRALSQTLEKDAPYEVEYRVAWQDGSVHHITARGKLTRDDKGGPMRLNGLIWDITTRKQMEEELRRSHDELEIRVRERTAELSSTVARLEQLNLELQEFAHVTSHDLQEPLRKIQTFSDMARKRYSHIPDNTGKDYLDRIVSSAQRMRQLLHDLLQLSRMSGKFEPFRTIDLGKIAREAADLFEDEFNKSGGTVEIDNLPIIDADETQMLRLFQNLIGNAVKYRNEKNPLVLIYSKRNVETYEIFITDNGIGFEQEYAERIFKPFQRLHGRNEYEGTGMGLAICRKIVERHGGSIRAESTPGKGSTFIISLPARPLWQD